MKTMERAEFECLPSSKQKLVASQAYVMVSRKLMKETHDQDIYFDLGGKLTETHHIWPRSHCPIWYTFNEDNLIPISGQLHYTVHSTAYSDMSKAEQEYYDILQGIKQKLIEENETYERQFTNLNR